MAKKKGAIQKVTDAVADMTNTVLETVGLKSAAPAKKAAKPAAKKAAAKPAKKKAAAKPAAKPAKKKAAKKKK